MEIYSHFSEGHKELIHDIAYDYYGKRLATCSSDLTIRLWSQKSPNQWIRENEFNPGHQNPVSRISWAHPEYGQVLASCSHDRTIRVHEEQIHRGCKNQWIRVASLTDSRDAVQDIKFAPRYHGLRLASASLDGFVRIYESNDMLDLSSWDLWAEFSPAPQPVHGLPSPDASVSCSCLSWNPSAYDPPMLVVGAKIGKRNVVQIWEHALKLQKWQMVAELDGHEDDIRDVQWAPDMGRGYHLIASASKKVRIFELRYDKRSETYRSKQLDLRDDTDEDRVDGEVWRVSWNLTGTILSSTGDDGQAKLWKNRAREQDTDTRDHCNQEWVCSMVANWNSHH